MYHPNHVYATKVVTVKYTFFINVTFTFQNRRGGSFVGRCEQIKNEFLLLKVIVARTDNCLYS